MNLPIRIALTISSAAMVVVSFPPVHWSCVTFVAWIPLLLAVRGSGSRESVLLGLIHGMVVFTGTLIWLVEIFGPMAFLLHFILAMFTVFFALISNTLDRPGSPPWLIGPVTAVLWTGIEYYRCEWFTLRFPWITPGTALPPNFLTPMVGVYGITFLIILAAAWLTTSNRNCRIAGLATLILVAISLVPNLDRDRFQNTSLQVTAIQGETLSFEEYLELSATCQPSGAILWPEHALNFDLRKQPEKIEKVRELMIAKNAEVFVVGSRTNHDDGTWSNTSIIVGRNSILGSHNKNRPVHFFDDGVPGKDAPAWPTPVGRVATPICFDNDYSSVPRRAVANGAEFLLIPSMDAEHWTSRQHLQHAELFRHRAAENGRWVVVAASSGLTQFIDPGGKRTAVLPLFEPGVLSNEIRPLSTLTPYTRFGWLLGPTCTILSGLLTLHAIVIQRRNGKRNSDTEGR